jgi:hypothetical protein
MKRRGFTLLELILANVVVAILIGGVMLMISGLARERQRMASVGPDPADAVTRALRWDLANAQTARLLPRGRGIVLVGQGGIDERTFSPTGRRTRVVYELRKRGNVVCLMREQMYLDDSVREQRWEEVVGVGIDRLSIAGNLASDEDDIDLDETTAFAIPASVRIQIRIDKRDFEREVWLR